MLLLAISQEVFYPSGIIVLVLPTEAIVNAKYEVWGEGEAIPPLCKQSVCFQSVKSSLFSHLENSKVAQQIFPTKFNFGLYTNTTISIPKEKLLRKQ